MTARYEAGKEEANAILRAQHVAAADAQTAIRQAAEAKFSKLQLQVCPASYCLLLHALHGHLSNGMSNLSQL